MQERSGGYGSRNREGKKEGQKGAARREERKW